MSLKIKFSRAANIGVIAQEWLELLERRFEAAGIQSNVRTGTDGAASLLAPAALIGQLASITQLDMSSDLSVLVLGDDPTAFLDGGMWLSFASELVGAKSIELATTAVPAIQSSLYKPGLALGLPQIRVCSVDDAKTHDWDMVIWVHPAIEASDSNELVELVAAIQARDIPVYACMYNELDAYIQSHGIAYKGLEFGWLNNDLATSRLTKDSVNKFGISTAQINIEGGWGAVLTRLKTASVTSSDHDWALIKTAMKLFTLEGSTSAKWGFGEVLAGVGFNHYRPIGLIGNMAVDPATGLVLSECPTNKVLNIEGQVWSELIESMPKSAFDLVPWAASVKLAFNSHLTKEKKQRADIIKLLRGALDSGIKEAGIALARGYEAVNSSCSKVEAERIYREIGATHPMSAYYLAHDALAKGDMGCCLRYLEASSAFGYAPATTDLGCLYLDNGDLDMATELLTLAACQGDSEAAFRLGELLIKQGNYELALKNLRAAWSKNHKDALAVAEWLCSVMLKTGIGKASHVERELKDVKFVARKRARLEIQATLDVA